MNTEGISVVLPSYNRATLVVRAVRSALESCSRDDEIIVIDDGSTDDTRASLSSYLGRITLIPLAHGGAGKARNAGVRIATRPLIAFLDSDDEWRPGYLEVKRRLMAARSDVLFCFSDFSDCSAEGEFTSHGLAAWHPEPIDWDRVLGPGIPLSALISLPLGIEDGVVHIGNLYPHEMAANYIPTPTLVVRRSGAGDALHFAEDLPTYEDWQCHGRLARVGRGAYISSSTALTHGHGGPRLTDADIATRTAARLAVLERVWGMDPEYLNSHGNEYAAVVQEQLKLLVRALLVAGRRREALQVLRHMEGSRVLLTLLAHLPPSVTRQAIRLRAAARLAHHRLALRGFGAPRSVGSQPAHD